MKRCTKCGIDKPLSDFYKQKTSSDGHGSWCKECQIANRREWVKQNPLRASEIGRRAKMVYKYKTTVAEYEAWLQDQEERCLICKRERQPGERRFHLDHDHETGAPRGVLCPQCNIGMGFFQHDPQLLIRAAAYLG